jgi:hypothetical protein
MRNGHKKREPNQRLSKRGFAGGERRRRRRKANRSAIGR